MFKHGTFLILHSHTHQASTMDKPTRQAVQSSSWANTAEGTVGVPEAQSSSLPISGSN